MENGMQMTFAKNNRMRQNGLRSMRVWLSFGKRKQIFKAKGDTP